MAPAWRSGVPVPVVYLMLAGPNPPDTPMSLTRFIRPLAALAVLATTAAAQGNNVTQQSTATPTDPKQIITTEGYLKPPALVEKIVTANRGAAISFTNPSPDRKWFMKLESEGLPTIVDFAKGHIYLGGLQVDTAGFRVRALTTRGSHSITLIEAETGKTKTFAAPDGVDISGASWSPDGKTIAYVGSAVRS